jgi:hypothetical protein
MRSAAYVRTLQNSEIEAFLEKTNNGIFVANYLHGCCKYGGTLRSRPFHLLRTLSDERSPRGTLTSHFGSTRGGSAGTNGSRSCHPDLPTRTYLSQFLKRRGDGTSALPTPQFPPSPHQIQGVPPESLGRTLYLFPSLNCIRVVGVGRKRFIYSLLHSIDFSTFHEESSRHANLLSRSRLAPLCLWRVRTRNSEVYGFPSDVLRSANTRQRDFSFSYPVSTGAPLSACVARRRGMI